MIEKPAISTKAFWDTRFDDLDFEKNKDYIIARVFEYGKWQDMIAVTKFYGEETVKASLSKHSFFYPDTISLISLIFNLSKEQLACYTNTPYRRIA